MSSYIEIDYRELKLKKEFESNSNFRFKNLDIGDILCYVKDELKLIIERKTISDLYSSIKDGRYHEQKTRLLSNYSNNNIIYLLEGDIQQHKKMFNIDIIYGSVVNTILRDKIKIIFSKDLDESIKFIKLLENRIINKPEFFCDKVECDYTNTIKLKKKDNVTPKLYQIGLIAQIQGLSITKAKIIIEKYGNLCNLIEFLRSDDLKELEDLKVNNRRLGTKAVSKMKEFLLS